MAIRKRMLDEQKGLVGHFTMLKVDDEKVATPGMVWRILRRRKDQASFKLRMSLS